MTAGRATVCPSMGDIAVAQKRELNLRRQAAASRFYSQAKRRQLLGGSLAIALALVAPIVLFAAPAQGPLLGAIAGGWIFLSRILVVPSRDRCRSKGVIAQEMFDCDVLGLAWNDALGKAISAEEIRGATKAKEDLTPVRDWYPAKGKAAWPVSVLICQRSNAVWARREHDSYAWLLVGVAVLWFLAGIGVAIGGSATLAAYLTTIALPSLPALLDASELGKSHFAAAKNRALLEETIDSLLKQPPSDIEPLREIQDEIFRLRKVAPLVPEWFYKLIAPSYEEDMQYAAETVTTESNDGTDC